MKTLPRAAFWAFAFLLILWIAMSRRDWVMPFSPRIDIPPAAMGAEQGRAYVAPLPAADFGEARARLLEGRRDTSPPLGGLAPVLGWSRVHYLLNGLIARRFPSLAERISWRPLGPGDVEHDEIRAKGAGRFSAWKGTLYFSPSDGSDPRTNGRLYRLELERSVPAAVRLLVQGITLALGGWLALQHLPERWKPRRLWSAVAPGLAISLVLLLLVFGAAEIYLRAGLVAFSEVNWPVREHPVAGMTFRPGEEVRWTNHADFWVIEKANSLGFLDREPAMPKPAGTFRILLLGDSFVEAAQVPIRSKVQVRLETRLRDLAPGRAIDVVAMGFSGSGTANALAFQEAFGASLAPDLVVLLVINKDLANNSPVLEAVRNGWHPHHTPRLFFEVDSGTPGGFRRVDIDPQWRSRIIHAAGTDPNTDYAARIAILRREPRFAALLEGWNFPDDLDMDAMFCAADVPPAFREAEALTAHAFRQFADAGRRQGFKVLVAAADNVTTVCENRSARRPTSRTAMVARVANAARSAGVAFVDLYPAVSAKGDFMKARFPYDSHWSETGHQWVSEALAEHLVRNPALLPR